jgi:hypothetical protein
MQDPLKTSLLCVIVYGITQDSQFLVVHKNLVFLRLHLANFASRLGIYPYKIQLTQALKVNDHTQRRVFADWVLGQLAVDPNFAKKIIFSDEDYFWMNGYVNKQNCRIWDDTNPHKIHQNKMHPEKVTVWCGFWSGGIIGPYFFQNETGITITVNR